MADVNEPSAKENGNLVIADAVVIARLQGKVSTIASYLAAIHKGMLGSGPSTLEMVIKKHEDRLDDMVKWARRYSEKHEKLRKDAIKAVKRAVILQEAERKGTRAPGRPKNKPN